jgi:hypothetical protein
MASIFLVVIYFWGMTVLVNSTLRYVLPATGLLFVLMGAAFGTKGFEQERTGFSRHAAA